MIQKHLLALFFSKVFVQCSNATVMHVWWIHYWKADYCSVYAPRVIHPPLRNGWSDIPCYHDQHFVIGTGLAVSIAILHAPFRLYSLVLFLVATLTLRRRHDGTLPYHEWTHWRLLVHVISLYSLQSWRITNWRRTIWHYGLVINNTWNQLDAVSISPFIRNNPKVHKVIHQSR